MAAVQTEDQAREYARIAADLCYFIDNYCLIYDKDTGAGFIPFKLWEGQRWMARLLCVLRMVLILKARQLGISWLIAGYIAWRMLFQRGFTAIIVSKTDDDAVEFVKRIRYILAQLPDWLRPRVDGPEHHLRVWAPGANGKWELFADAQAKAQTKNAGRSLTASVVVLDEYAFMQWAREIWRAAYPIFSRPTGGQVFVLSTMQLGTHFAEQCREAMRKQGDGVRRLFFAFLPWWVRPDRDIDWYRAALGNLKADAFSEFPSTPEEAFRTRTGRLVPEYDETIHFIEPFQIKPEWGWRWLEAIDPGSTAPTAYELCAVDPRGRLFFVDELYMPGAKISEVVAEIRKTRERWGLLPKADGAKVDTTLIDPASQSEKSQEIAADFMLYLQEFRKQGVPVGLMPANNEPGIARLRERFETFKAPDDSPLGYHWDSNAFVFKNCTHFNDQIMNLVWDAPKYEGENVTTWTGPDHAFDGGRYASNRLPRSGKGPEPAAPSPVATAKAKLMKSLQAQRRRSGIH